MPRSSSLLRILALVILSVFLVSCVYAMGAAPPKTTTTTAVSSASPGADKYISADIFTDKGVYKIGEPIKITIKTENTGNTMLKSYYRSSKKSEVIIYDDRNNLVWNSSYGKVALTVVVPFELKPDEKIEDKYTWLQQKNDGKEIAPGKYYVQGKINISSPIATKLQAIQIVDQ